MNRLLSFTFFSGLFLLALFVSMWSGIYYWIAIPFAVLFFYSGWQHIYTVFFLLLCSIPFSAEFQVTSTLGTDFPDEPLMLFTAGLVFCYWLYSPGILPRKIIGHPLIYLLAITFAWSVVSTLPSTDHLISVKFLLAKCWYIGAFVFAPLIVFKEKKVMKNAFLAPALGMLVITIVTICRHYSYGFSFVNINDALYPFFRNHVSYSAMLVCMIPVFFAIRRLSSSKSQKKWINLAILVLLLALFLSYSRGAWLALVVGGLSWWLIRKKLLIAGYIAVILIMLASLFWLKTNDRYLEYAPDYRSTIFHIDFREHLAATYQLKDLSTEERFYRWIAGIRMIKDNPFTGYGPNTFYYNYKPYAVPAFRTYVSNNKEHTTVHNYFLLLTIEQGIPGLIFFLLLTGVMLYYAQHLYYRTKDEFYKTVAITTGVIIMMILTVNFLSDLVETDKIGSLFFLSLSALIITDINTKPVILTKEI
jgi:O-antigen ligase